MLDKTKELIGEQKLTDPVCGMTITQSSEFHLHHEDKDKYFCGRSCLEKFQDNPGIYLNPKLKIVRYVPMEAVATAQRLIPARCILKLNNRDQVPALSVAWRWSLRVCL